ncbi:MAG: arylsulfatase [Candidatus Glassbacteria bacterium]|nr:arylsulfatase [Candidatus Glassbacteria bacterium]
MAQRTTSRREFIRRAAAGAAAATLAGALPAFSGGAGDGARPNIIVIMADDLGYGDLGCFGATLIPTPNIDRLAAGGVTFTDAHSPASLCTPTRYAVLTGRYCWRSPLKKGVTQGYDPLLIDPSRLTIAGALRQAGYRTACIGKWHLGLGERKPVDYSGPLTPGPRELGFDYFFGIPASLDMPPYCFVENDRVVGELSVPKRPRNTLQREGPMTPGWRDEEVGPTFVRKAERFIDDNARNRPGRPFFIYLPYQAPHTPCTPPGFIEGRSGAGVRGDMVVELDWAVGRITEALRRNGLERDTLVIVTSDNGALTSGISSWAGDPPEKYDLVHNGHKPNGELRGQKADIWDGGHREPLIASWPAGIEGGRKSGRLFCLTDLMATCAAAAGVDLPDNAGEDSFNQLPAITGAGQSGARRESVVHHSGAGMFSLRRDNWKLVLGRGSGGFSAPQLVTPGQGEPRGQLYDMAADRAEQANLWNERPEVVQNLLALLEDIVRRGRSTPGPDQPNEGEVDIWAGARQVVEVP